MSTFDDCLRINNVVGSANLCTGQVEWNEFNYEVSKGACYFFTIAFALSCLIHTGQAIKFRTWSMLWTAAACAALEALGWGGRLGVGLNEEWFPVLGGYWSNVSDSFFLMQICTLIIAPAFLAAACYIILGWLINYLGPQYSPLRPRTYLILFVTGDVISLVIQAAGGGMASAADTLDGANKGADVMLAGIVFQLIIMLAFFTVYFLFLSKLRKGLSRAGIKSDRKPMILLYGIFAVMFFIFIRSVYRVAELSHGWNSSIIHNQGLFNALDGAMMIVAVYLLNIFHPGQWLPKGNYNVKARAAGIPLTEKNSPNSGV